MADITNSKILQIILFLFAVCIFSFPAQAADVNDSEITADVEVSTYVFVSDQSTMVQTGGIAGVHWTYSVEGQFQLSVDPNAGIASFVRVDANATDDSPYRRTLDPNEVFNMTELVGTVIGDTIIAFTGKAADSSDILIIAFLNDDLVYLVGQTFPPAGSADFFIFNMDAVAQRKYGGGTGTADDPYQIATASDLIALGESPEDYDKHFILTADIDLDPNLPGRKVFDKAVIASDTPDTTWRFDGVSFTGVFDGNSHTISNLTIVGKEYLGLFGQLGRNNQVEPTANIKDLWVVDVNIVGSYRYIGGIAGFNDGEVIHCYSTGVVRGDFTIGGLLGFNCGTVIDCYSSSTVSGISSDIGGLVGSNWHGKITNCYSTGLASGSYCVGGLVGNNVGNMTNCYSTGAVTGNEAIGGLVGRNGLQGAIPYPGYIDKSSSIASVRGETFVGGLVGDNRCGDVRNCYSSGVVSGSSCVGGLVGFIAYASLSNCYSTGLVIGTGEYIGGLVGGGWLPNVSASFWDMQTSGQTTSYGGTGKTTAEMQTASTFLEAGWDFVDETENGTEDIWWILEGQDYPRLYWELVTNDHSQEQGQ